MKPNAELSGGRSAVQARSRVVLQNTVKALSRNASDVLAPGRCSGTLGGRCRRRAETNPATDRDGRWMPARAGRRDFWHDTERLSRDLDRPARGLAASETFQAETGPADNDALTTTNGDLAVGCVRVAKAL